MGVAIENLVSEKCVCGGRKCVRHSFCTDCYFALPLALRGDLYSHDVRVYEAAYEAACKFLRELHP